MAKTPRYPIFVLSKGRWESRLTSKALDRMRVPYRMIVEPQEAEAYAAAVGAERLLILPEGNQGLGSIPARNAAWAEAERLGAARHWVLDDNIEAFNRLNRNCKPEVETGAMFAAAEDFVDRYENVPLAGFNYYCFAKASEPVPPYYLNTRVYSCILLDTSLPFRWRGRYNEDTDLSLRVLKAGYCTVLFNAFLAGKVTTMRMRGGNTDVLYAGDGRKAMAESLAAQHPDLVKVVWKFGRWQHSVDYRPFRATRLRRRQDVVVPTGVDNYGMVLRTFPRVRGPRTSIPHQERVCPIPS
jgi:hypothetical protein